MSTFLLIPLNDQGTFEDRIIAPVLQEATASPAKFTDLFLFSHGWWTNASRSMVDYDQFLAGFTRCLLVDPYAQPLAAPVLGNYFATGLHWPSVLTEDSASVLNYAEALSFFTMRARADSVGANGAYAALNVALRSGTVGTIHLIGHSFGCRVVCSAVQKLLTKDPACFDNVDVRVCLIEPALDQEDLETGDPVHRYARVLQHPNVRTLITRSNLDVALCLGYPLANVIGDVVNHLGGDGVARAASQLLAHLGRPLSGIAEAAGTIAAHLVDLCKGVKPETQVDGTGFLGAITAFLQRGDAKELVVARLLLHALGAANVDVGLAAGGAGLRPQFVQELGSRYTAVSVGPGWPGATPPQAGVARQGVVVVDLSELHARPGAANPPWNDHHSDFYLPEVYRLVAWFLFSNRAEAAPAQPQPG